MESPSLKVFKEGLEAILGAVVCLTQGWVGHGLMGWIGHGLA